MASIPRAAMSSSPPTTRTRRFANRSAWTRSGISRWTACWSRCPEGRTDFATRASPATTRPRRPRIPTSSASGADADLTTREPSSVQPSVYFFGNGNAEGTKDMKAILGGKGANLAEMTNLGVPVPPGFTIACEACIAYLRDGVVPDELRLAVEENLRRLETASGKRFGDSANPLLVSVRSGAPVSMPGMMETILNLGLNDLTVAGLARASGNARFAYDSFRRFIQMYGDVVLGVSHARFEQLLATKRLTAGVENDAELSEE